jgi:hypothetical protein
MPAVAFCRERIFMRWNLWLALVVLGGLVGCGGAQPAKPNAGGDSGEAETDSSGGPLKSYTAAELPPIDDPLPIMDEGRVQISLPTGWKPLKRKPQILVAAIPEEGSAAKFPRIMVTVADPTIGDKASITTSNAQGIAGKLQAQLKKSPIERCTPVALGDNVWIRHVRAAKASDGVSDLAIQSLQTIKSGRLYTVELTVDAKNNPRSSNPPIIYEKPLKAHRDFAYAVAANMKFPKEDGGAPATETKPAEEKPAEEKSAEKPAEPEKTE